MTCGESSGDDASFARRSFVTSSGDDAAVSSHRPVTFARRSFVTSQSPIGELRACPAVYGGVPATAPIADSPPALLGNPSAEAIAGGWAGAVTGASAVEHPASIGKGSVLRRNIERPPGGSWSCESSASAANDPERILRVLDESSASAANDP